MANCVAAGQHMLTPHLLRVPRVPLGAARGIENPRLVDVAVANLQSIRTRPLVDGSARCGSPTLPALGGCSSGKILALTVACLKRPYSASLSSLETFDGSVLAAAAAASKSSFKPMLFMLNATRGVRDEVQVGGLNHRDASIAAMYRCWGENQRRA